MKKLLLLFVLLVLSSCFNSGVQPYGSELSENQNIVTSASGVQYPNLDPPAYQYCGPGWGRKMCRFLSKYDETTWADPDNYYGTFSDIRFSNFSDNEYFISFFNSFAS